MRALTTLVIGVFAAITLTLVPRSGEAATLHAIYVADTTDPIIGHTTSADLDHVMPMMEAMAEVTGLDYHQVVFSEETFLKHHVLRFMQYLNVGSDDVVLFYYSGHGGRSASKVSKWPDLLFRLDDEMVDLELMAKTVSGMRPRLGLVIADACNNVLPGLKIKYPNASANSIDERALGNLMHLFRESRGIWLVAAAGVGDVSYADSSGGFFTGAFLQSLNYGMLYAPKLQWQEVFEVASWTLQGVQEPIYQLLPSPNRRTEAEAA
jgi:hypothetical protein